MVHSPPLMTMKMEKVLRGVPGVCLPLPLSPSMSPHLPAPWGRPPDKEASEQPVLGFPGEQDVHTPQSQFDTLWSLSHVESSKVVTAGPEKLRVCHSPGLLSGLV